MRGVVFQRLVRALLFEKICAGVGLRRSHQTFLGINLNLTGGVDIGGPEGTCRVCLRIGYQLIGFSILETHF